MGVDPLSTATRTAKRNLLATSMLAITYRAFDIGIDKIPFSGVSITFNPGVFAFLLTAGLLYFSITFALYYYIDAKNIKETAHETGMSKLYHDKVRLHSRKAAQIAYEQIKGNMPKGYCAPPHNDGLHLLFEQVSKNSIIDAIRLRPLYDISSQRILRSDRTMNLMMRSPTIETDPEAFKHLEGLMKPYLRYYWWTYHLTRLRYSWVRARVRLTYLIRNYVVDGAIPILMSLIALASLYRITDLHWLRMLAPER